LGGAEVFLILNFYNLHMIGHNKYFLDFGRGAEAPIALPHKYASDSSHELE